VSNPVYAEGHLAILRGNLATEGAVAKIPGVKNQDHGPRVSSIREASLAAILAARSVGDVLVIRYEGPEGGPGMARDAGADVGDHRRRPRGSVALITTVAFPGHLRHGRWSRRSGSSGRRTIALVQEGDSSRSMRMRACCS